MNTDTSPPFSSIRIFLMWSILLLGYFLNYFHSLSTAILQPYLIQEFQISSQDVTAIGSMYFYFYLLMQIPTGLLVDKFSVRLVSGVALALASLGTLLFAMATHISMLYIGRSLIGIGTATIFVCILKFQITWMPANKLTTMTGIACFVGTLGGMFAQSPLVWLIEVAGWRGSLYVITLITFINALLIFLFIKEKSITKTITQANQKISLGKAFFSILKNGRTWPPLCIYAAFYGSYVTIMGYSGVSWLNNNFALSDMQSSSYISLGVFGSAVGSVIVGLWSDKIASRKKPMLVVGALYTVLWFVLGYLGNALPLSVIIIVLFSLGVCSTAFVVCWSCVQENNPKEYSGIAASMVNMGGFIGPIVFPYLFVSVQGNQTSLESFALAFQSLAWVVLICYCIAFFVKEPKK